MTGNFKKEDLRIKKTYYALINAMLIMLKKKNFNQITVNDICCEALISRATFYIHFNDKYDLLKYWLSDLNGTLVKDLYNYEELEENINAFIQKNKYILANILIDANNETLDLINQFVSVIIEEIIEKYGNIEKKNASVLSDFCTGGIVSMIQLQIKKHFHQDDNVITIFLFDMVRNIMEWANDRQDN